MTETIQTLKEDIAILQEKLKKLEELEIQKSKTPIEKAYCEVYGEYPRSGHIWNGFLTGYDAGYEEAVKNNKNFEPTPQTPEQVEQGLRDAMKQAKEDGVFDEPKPETLFDIMRHRLGYSIDCCDEIVDAVEEWLPKQDIVVEQRDLGWNDAIETIKSKLK